MVFEEASRDSGDIHITEIYMIYSGTTLDFKMSIGILLVFRRNLSFKYHPKLGFGKDILFSRVAFFFWGGIQPFKFGFIHKPLQGVSSRMVFMGDQYVASLAGPNSFANRRMNRRHFKFTCIYTIYTLI